MEWMEKKIEQRKRNKGLRKKSKEGNRKARNLG